MIRSTMHELKTISVSERGFQPVKNDCYKASSIRLQPGAANYFKAPSIQWLEWKAGGYSIRYPAKPVRLSVLNRSSLPVLGLIHCQHGANARQDERLAAS